MTASSFSQALPRENKFFTTKIFPDAQYADKRLLFLSLFNPWNYIIKPLDADSNWISANEKWKLKPSEIFKAVACHHQKFYIGTRGQKFTRFAILDIDKNSPYHNKESLQGIYVTLEDAGLKDFCLYRSSFSGGWHLYIFFEEPVDSRLLRNSLVRVLSSSGYAVKSGSLEVFPNLGEPGSLGYGIRLPLQPGFAWLDNYSAAIVQDRLDMSPTDALDAFLDDLQEHAHTYRDFQNLVEYAECLTRQTTSILVSINRMPDIGIDETRPTVSATQTLRAVSEPTSIRSGAIVQSSDDHVAFVIDVFGYVPPGMNCSTWMSGRDYAVQGLTMPSQRHDCSFAMNHYFFYGDPSKDIDSYGYDRAEERFAIVNEIMQLKHNGLSKQLSRGQRDAVENIRRQAQWKPPLRRIAQTDELTDCESKPAKPTLRPQEKLRRQLANRKRSNEAREKIKQAVETLLADGFQISLSSIHEASGVAVNTIRKHADLWKHFQEEQYEDLFAGLSGDLNAVVAGGSSKEPTSRHSQKFVPAGLLACRQVLYELNMREVRRRRVESRKTTTVETNAESLWLSQVEALVLRSLNLSIERLSLENECLSIGEWQRVVSQWLPVSLSAACAIDLQAALKAIPILLASAPSWELQQMLKFMRMHLSDEAEARSLCTPVGLDACFDLQCMSLSPSRPVTSLLDPLSKTDDGLTATPPRSHNVPHPSE